MKSQREYFYRGAHWAFLRALSLMDHPNAWELIDAEMVEVFEKLKKYELEEE